MKNSKFLFLLILVISLIAWWIFILHTSTKNRILREDEKKHS